MEYDDKILMTRVLFEKGAVGAVHEHFHSQATYVVSGRFELQAGDRKEVIGPGDGFYIPSNVAHGAVSLEKGEFSALQERTFLIR